MNDFPVEEWMRLDSDAKHFMARLARALRREVITIDEWKDQLDDQGRPGIGAEDWLDQRMPDWAMETYRDVEGLTADQG